MVDEGEGFALVPRNQSRKLQVQARHKIRLAKATRGRRLPDGQVVMADRTEQEGLAGLDLAGVVRLEADSRLAVHPDLRGVRGPLVVVRLHPLLTCRSVTVVGGLIVPLPRRTTRNVGPGITVLSGLATEPSSELLITGTQPIFGHANDDAIADAVVQVCSGRSLASMALTHDRVDHADVNLRGGGLLRCICSLRSNDLASNQCTTSGRRNG